MISVGIEVYPSVARFVRCGKEDLQVYRTFASITSVLAAWLCVALSVSADTPGAIKNVALSAVKSGDAIVIESKGGPVTYKVVVDAKRGGDISDLQLPADGKVVGREINDLFFLGEHGDEYTLRGWTGPNKFTISCSADLVSQKADEIVVRVNLLTTGTFKILVKDEAEKAELRKAHASYKDKTLEVKRVYTFKADRVLVDDEFLWMHPEMEFKTFYFTAAFMPGCVQGPARLVKGAEQASFYGVSSGGKKLPVGISYPFTSENFLKDGYKVSVRTAAASFDLAKSDFYFYEKTWQQDWHQLAGFMYRVTGQANGKAISAKHEIVFAKATQAEMPPVVTIRSPSPDARWMDEKGEVAKYKIGDVVKLAATAVNSDGSPVPDEDISWEIHVDPWWNTPAVTLRGANLSYTIPEVANEEDKATAKDRNLVAVITVKVKGKNGTESAEPFAMLVGKAEK
jgi:hypothetical protein